MSIWNSECLTRGLCFVILINLFLIKMEFAFDFPFLPTCCLFIEYLHTYFFSPSLTRFVGDQEAWHELAELYINEHE